jgi:hypothetical protein
LKKSLTVLLVSSMLVGYSYQSEAMAASNVSLSDISTHWGKADIIKGIDHGYVDGYGDGTFLPDNNVSRAEFLKMAVIAMNLPVNGATSGSEWYKPYIAAATEKGILRTTDFPIAAINNPITRLEMARISVRAADVKLQDKTVQIDDKTALYKATKSGLIQGLASGDLAPNNSTTRAQSVTIIERILSVLKGDVLPVDDAAFKNAEKAMLEAKTGVIPDDSIFQRKDISKISSYGLFRVKDGKFLFSGSGVPAFAGLPAIEGFTDYELKSTTNPQINKQVYDVTKVLLDENHFVNTSYQQGDDTTPSRVFIGFAKNNKYAANGYNLFKYILFEDRYFDNQANWLNEYPTFSKKVVISLLLGKLWFESKDKWSTPFYEDKLKSSLKGLFGEATGQEAYDYIFDIYLKNRTAGEYTNIKTTKTIGNIQIDYGHEPDQGSELIFHFSYVQ